MNYEAFISSVTVMLYIRVLWYLLCYCEDPLSVSVPTFILKQVLPALPSDTSIDCELCVSLSFTLLLLMRRLCQSGGSCFFDALLLDVFAIGWEKFLDGENECSGKLMLLCM